MIQKNLYSEIETSLTSVKNVYLGKDVVSLSEDFNITSKCKQVNSLIVRAIFSSCYEELLYNSRVIIKTVQVDKYDKLSQALSFPAFDYEKLVTETWENSSLRKFLNESIFIFAVFKNDNERTYLYKLFAWEVPEEIIDKSIRNVWNKTKTVLEKGNIVKYIENNKLYTNFPSAKENPYMHVRPHSQSKEDVKKLPFPDKLTGLTVYEKHCFWFNKLYINKIINDYE